MNPILQDRLAQLDGLTLDKGSHDSFEEGHCAMEVVAWLAGREHTDRPQCVSVVLGAFLRPWNDSLDEAPRQQLKSYLPRCVGTADDGRDEQRAWLCTDWLARIYAPAWLDLAGLDEHASTLRGLPELRDLASAMKAQPKLNAAWSAAEAAEEAAEAAARAAGSAAWSAAEAAAASAARAAGSAAWSAAEAAAVSAAGSAAEAAGLAAEAAMRSAARAAGSAAWWAAWSAAASAAGAAGYTATWGQWAAPTLAPTRTKLRASAFELLDRMLPVETGP